jgi:hypothetical protein
MKPKANEKPVLEIQIKLNLKQKVFPQNILQTLKWALPLAAVLVKLLIKAWKGGP